MSSEAADKSLIRVLKAKGDATIALFERSDGYFASYGTDCRLLASEVFKSDVCVKRIMLSGDVPMQYISLGLNQYKRVVRELIMFLRYRVELYALQEGQWKLKAKGTVGNAGDFEDVIGDVSSSGSTVMAVSISGDGNNHVSTCFWDMDELRVTTTEFNDTAVFSQTEQCVVGMNPRECLLVDCNEPSKKKALSTILQRAGVMLTVYRPVEKVTDEQFQKVFRTLDFNLAEPLKALGKVLYTFFSMRTQPQFEKKFILSDYKTSGYMHLDGAAVRALELFSTNYFHDESTNGTLFGVLNKCKSAGGQRLLRDWLARPLCDVRPLKERQDAISALIDCPVERNQLRNILLSKVPDVAQLSRKLLQKRARLQDCYRIYQLIGLLGHIEKCLRTVYHNNEEAAAIKEMLLEPICYGLSQFDKYNQLISSTIDIEYLQKTSSFRIKPSIDPSLQELADEMEEMQGKMVKVHKKVCARLEVDTNTVKLDSNAQHGYFYRVTLKDEKHIRKSRDLTIVSTTKGSGVLFRDDALTELNDRYVELNGIYLKTQADLERKVVEICAGYTVSLTQLNTALAVVDVLVALATVAAESAHPYVRPVLEPMGSGVLELRGCRHAVLETSLGGQFIPNDVLLDKETRMLVLTGANMGGKSTYLRSAAICVLLAQIGSFVPASVARISIVDGIFTRVGASDQQTKGISTFMAEMLDSSSILQAATSGSLVIVDELGRGTSTFDGFGLAWAIASDLLKKTKCFCLYATHFHEMADLEENEGAKAMQMTVNAEEDRLVMLYEIKPGRAVSSFGIAVARMVGFPENVVIDAVRELKRLEGGKAKQLKEAKNEDLRQLILNL